MFFVFFSFLESWDGRDGHPPSLHSAQAGRFRACQARALPLRCLWERGVHVRSSEGEWTSHLPNLYSGSVCRSAETPASRTGTNSITDSWLAGECAVALGKWKKSLLSSKEDRGEKGHLPLDWTRPVSAICWSQNSKDQIRLIERQDCNTCQSTKNGQEFT